MQQQPLRRTIRLVTGGAAALAMTASLMSCSTDASAPAASHPVEGGTLVVASNSDTDCLDPHQSPLDVTLLYARPILDSLVNLTDDGKVHPWLAKSWTVSDDQLTYTFKLRDDVTFTDGEKFNAAAVKANFDHIVAPKTGSTVAVGYLGPFVGASVVDDDTVKVKFSSPYSAFLPTVATALFGMEAPSTLAQDPAKLCRVIVGTGPFLSNGGYVPQQGISYVKNPDYKWAPETAAHQGPAHLDALKITVVPDDSVRMGELSSGEVDAIGGVPPVNVSTVKADSNLYIDSAPAPGGNYNYYPNTKHGVFSDIAVRQAFRAGIDFDTLIKSVYFGQFEPAKSPIAPNTQYYDKAQEASYKYDPDAAAKLLDGAGWIMGPDGVRVKDGKPLEIHMKLVSAAHEQRNTLAQQVQAAAAKLGFHMVIDPVDFGGFAKAVGSSDYDLVEVSFQRASPDVLRSLFNSEFIPNGSINTAWSGYSDPTIDKVTSEALSTMDPGKLKDLYATAQQEVAKQAIVFPQYVFSYIVGARATTQGIDWEPQAFPTFYDAWKTSK